MNILDKSIVFADGAGDFSSIISTAITKKIAETILSGVSFTFNSSLFTFFF